MYDKRVEEISVEMDGYKKSLASMNELYVEQQKRVDKLFGEMADKDALVDKRVEAKNE